jgi:hypothetical protein
LALLNVGGESRFRLTSVWADADTPEQSSGKLAAQSTHEKNENE